MFPICKRYDDDDDIISDCHEEFEATQELQQHAEERIDDDEVEDESDEEEEEEEEDKGGSDSSETDPPFSDTSHYMQALLEEYFTCGVCCEVYVKPSVLSCGHVFCSNCLRQWMNRIKLNCPVCRQTIRGHIPLPTIEQFIERIISTQDLSVQRAREAFLYERELNEYTLPARSNTTHYRMMAVFGQLIYDMTNQAIMRTNRSSQETMKLKMSLRCMIRQFTAREEERRALRRQSIPLILYAILGLFLIVAHLVALVYMIY